MRNILFMAALIVSSGATECFSQQTNADLVQLHWKPTAGYNGKDNLDLALVLKNTSNAKIDLGNWELWFNAMYPVVEKKTSAYSFTNERGNLFRLQFAGQILSPNDSLVMEYTSKYAISNISTAPNGFYLQDKANHSKYHALNNVKYSPIVSSAVDQNAFNLSLFEKNELLNKVASTQPIFPTPKSIKVGKGMYEIASNLRYYVSPDLDLQFDVVDDILLLKGVKFMETSVQDAQLIIKKVSNLKNEGYRLVVTNNGIQIESSSSSGVFYALQSLRSMFTANMLLGTDRIRIPYVTVDDEPRYSYRGFMMDIARNFKDKTTILKYLDLMAKYKLNVFHFHFIDDEGWRIEIPSLPELTVVGANRSPLFKDGQSLQPAYGSGAASTAGSYLTRSDFVEIIRYAHQRNITIIPEIETPGHARASIKAMQARYQRLMKAGKKQEAEKYLLYDADDKSEYSSVQYFNDNVINPALPSTYLFLEQVIDEFISMYKDANVPLRKVSIGGDEVPNGVWAKSPKILALMEREGMGSVHEVWPYYIQKANEICIAKGIQMAGWEEIGMVNKGNGMVVNPELPNKSNIQVDVWNNVIGGGQEDLAYKLANAGYSTVLISASNMYLDMMWNTNFTEPGLKWATYADLFHSYSLLPEDFFANIDTYYSGKKLGKEGFSKRVRLNEKGKSNFLGIKGGLWAETVQTESQMDYLVFPRFFALAERAWSEKRSYESEDRFDLKLLQRDYTLFLNKVGRHELPKIANNVKFRLPAVGVKEVNGKVKANTEYPGFTIYFTKDGSVPTAQSLKYDSSKPVLYRTGDKLSFAVVDDNGRVGQVSTFTK